jgi:hypothetical protein
MLGKLKQHLVDDCRFWWKRWSSWLAYLWGFVGAFFWLDPSWMTSLVAAIPGDVRMTTSPVIWIALAGLPILITNLKQKKLAEAKAKCEAEKQASGG